MAEKINVGKFINNLDSEDLSSEKLQGVVGNVYAKAIRDHKTTAKKAEDNLKDKDKETVEFTKSNHDRLKAHKNKPEKDLNKDDAPVKDKVVKEINESFSIKDFKKQWAEYKKSGSSDELEFGDWYYQFDVDFDKGTIFAGEPHKDIMGWSISRDFEIKLDPSVDIYGNISKLHDYIETKRRGVKESKKQRSPFRKVNESHDCKRNYKNVRFASQEIEKKGYSHAEANDIALKLFDDIEGDTQRSLEWHLEKILPKEEFDKEYYPRNEALVEDMDPLYNERELLKSFDWYNRLKRTNHDTTDAAQEIRGICRLLRLSKPEYRNRATNAELIDYIQNNVVQERHGSTRYCDDEIEESLIEGDNGSVKNFPNRFEELKNSVAEYLEVLRDPENHQHWTTVQAISFGLNDVPIASIKEALKDLGIEYIHKGDFDYVLNGDTIEDVERYYNDDYGDDFMQFGESLIKESAEKIQPGNIYSVLVKELPAEDINHHYSDLYVRKTPKSTEIVNRLTTKSLLSTFKDNIDGDIWYELPFCYVPYFGESKELTETPIPRNATKIKVGGKEFTKEKDWVDGNRVHVSPKDIKRLYGNDVEVLETDPNYKSKRTKEVKVLQGNYGYGWDDLVEYDKEDSAELKQDLRSYRENERNARFRVITRRVPLGEEKLTEGKKIDLYVNGEYVCSSTRYKKVKDFVDAVKKDGKVTYAGLDNNGKLSDKVTKTIKDTDKVVGRIVTESKKLEESAKSWVLFFDKDGQHRAGSDWSTPMSVKAPLAKQRALNHKIVWPNDAEGFIVLTPDHFSGINYDELQKLYNAGGISTGKLDRSIPFTESKKLKEAKSSKKLIYTIGDRFVAHQLDGVTSPFNREFDASKKYRDISNDPNFKHGSIGCKGKSYKAGVNQWVKDVEPTEFMVWTKKENPSWKDDVLDVYYRKESIHESKTPYGDTTIEDYVNANFSGSQENKNKLIAKMREKANGSNYFNGLNMSVKDWEKTGKEFGLTMKRYSVTESKKLTEEVHDGDMFEFFGLQFSLTWLDHTGDEPDEFAIVCDSIPNDYDNEPTWIGKTVGKDATEKEIKKLCWDWIYDQPEETFKDFEVVNELPDGTWFFADEETVDSLKKEFGKNMEWLPHENMWQLYRPKEKMKADVDELPWDPWEKELDYAEKNYGPDESLTTTDSLKEDLSKIQEEQTMKLVRLLGKGLITKQEFEQKLYGIIDNDSKLVRAPMFKNIKIKDFYTDNYPEDDLGEEINDTVTVDDVVDTLNNGGDLYKLIGVTDSLVRERLFEFIADICNTKYDRVYNKWLEEGLVETGRKFLIESQTQEIEQIMNRLKKEFGPEIEAKMDEFVNLPENSKKVWKSGYKIIPDEEIEKDYEITYFQTPEHEPMYARKSDGSYARYGQVLDYSDIFYTEEGWNKFEKWLNDQGIFDTSTHFAISKFDNWPDGYWSTDTERFSTVDGAKRVADRKFKSADVVKIEDDRTHFGTANGETVRFKGKWMTEDDFFKLRNSKKA